MIIVIRKGSGSEQERRHGVVVFDVGGFRYGAGRGELVVIKTAILHMNGAVTPPTSGSVVSCRRYRLCDRWEASVPKGGSAYLFCCPVPPRLEDKSGLSSVDIILFFLAFAFRAEIVNSCYFISYNIDTITVRSFKVYVV